MNSRSVTLDMGSMAPYLQNSTPLIPKWVTDQVIKYTKYGAGAGFAIGGMYSLWNGLSLSAMAGNILSGTLMFGLVGGLAKLGYNILKHYKVL